ncbi:MAG: hypothetical protein COV91_05950 [Candidatus Taylorbacteria bacterium CG11_big_fil_rev_8_21_14_0_20_46_11]|uniref:DUF559 domain-containing protein n=1 Tax=Candidatus Taylorbacteria bacterium CG11_big_fil_rev_8_21_14_0_20_46_11 TaxID=1975025 RepID=A0A2H0K9Z8_9BACT|nr:MAG: hypothetical protein COV91_05950 [Candidatus Taylorbacteria bacterium CG11_big_fil_rev_8_21_14_0_20_46_11]
MWTLTTQFLEQLSLHVIRFGNNEINTNFNSVVQRIMKLLEM